MLGLEKGAVKIVGHSPSWARLFAVEKQILESIIGEFVLQIEHIGSTAVKNLDAKPIIDIAVAVEKISDAQKCVAPLKNAGYTYKGENGIAGRHYLSKGEQRRTHHLHIVEQSSGLWREHLKFRDSLRAGKEIARKYAKLKRDLATRFPFDRESYTNGKAAFIQQVLQDF